MVGTCAGLSCPQQQAVDHWKTNVTLAAFKQGYETYWMMMNIAAPGHHRSQHACRPVKPLICYDVSEFPSDYRPPTFDDRKLAVEYLSARLAAVLRLQPKKASASCS